MTYLANLMFRRLGKFGRPLFGWDYIRGGWGAYIRHVNWVTYFVGVYSRGRRVIGILRHLESF